MLILMSWCGFVVVGEYVEGDLEVDDCDGGCVCCEGG